MLRNNGSGPELSLTCHGQSAFRSLQTIQMYISGIARPPFRPDCGRMSRSTSGAGSLACTVKGGRGTGGRREINISFSKVRKGDSSDNRGFACTVPIDDVRSNSLSIPTLRLRTENWTSGLNSGRILFRRALESDRNSSRAPSARKHTYVTAGT